MLIEKLIMALIAHVNSAETVRSLFGPFVEPIKSWNLPDWLVHWGHPGNMVSIRMLHPSIHMVVITTDNYIYSCFSYLFIGCSAVCHGWLWNLLRLPNPVFR